MRKSISFFAVAFAAVSFVPAFAPAAASAHVTLSPNTAAAGSWSTFNVKVPNESDSASTVKVAVKMPQGITYASWQPVGGWEASVNKVKLATPVQTDDGPVTDGVSEVVWTATGKGVEPGQFQQFPITLLVPDVAGTELTFKAVQTYSDGKVSRWIGSAGSDMPAPMLSVTAKEAGHGTGAHSREAHKSDDTLGVIGIVLGGLALVTAAVALITVRRKRG
jgi:uncharacterized protein YcnI